MQKYISSRVELGRHNIIYNIMYNNDRLTSGVAWSKYMNYYNNIVNNEQYSNTILLLYTIFGAGAKKKKQQKPIYEDER